MSGSKTCRKGSCAHCSQAEHIEPQSGLRGWPLAGVLAVVFMLPLLLAIVGAVVAEQNGFNETAGAGTGLIAGFLVGVVGSKFVKQVKGVSR